MHRLSKLFLSTVLLFSFGLYAQEVSEPTEEQPTQLEVEQVVVIGTQIRGASVSDILPVSVLDNDALEALGVDSGDELMDLVPEQGQNLFNEEENISGGVNSARGDIGAFNLRNLGTGNTLVLLNGRRMVNAAGFQTEAIGGSFVPVNTVNSNHLPVFGVRRVELLKDGASAIYGADAVAGVVNTVLKDDIDRFRIRTKLGSYENVGRETQEVNLEWGTYFNNEKTHIGVMFDNYNRDPIRATEDRRWIIGDLRLLTEEFEDEDRAAWANDTRFRNTSAHSLYGQFDVRSSVRNLDIRNVLTDTSGEFETFPAGHPNCTFEINDRVCGDRDGNGTYRYNLNEFRDLSSDLNRNMLFLFLNHDFANGMESFTEFMHYQSSTVMNRHPSYSFSSVKLRVGAENYYNPFGPCGSPNRLPEEIIGNVPCSGLELEIDNYRYAELPRIVNVDGTAYRFLQGLRGTSGKWDWETAVLFSAAEKEDVTNNRVSNTLMAEALFDPTPAAYNPFNGGIDTNIERALIDVRRDSKATLSLADFKISTAELFAFGDSAVAGLAGGEVRRESFEDDRDPRLDGTIAFTDYQGDTYPLVSDVVNSSPTPDNKGDRTVTSLFGELQIPVAERIDTQVALRYENFSDVGSTVVGKFAGGFRVADPVLLRASWSQSFRVPNLVTVNENVVARQNTRTDYACLYASLYGGDPEQDIVDCRNSTQRVARGSENLESESSVNTSLGIVFEPNDDLTLTLDYWTIEKEDTIGLFGEENHTVWDLYLRLQHGAGNCGSLQANEAVIRLDPAEDEIAVYEAAGICPAGLIHRVEDQYANLDTRTLAGYDLAIYWDIDTRFGDFKFKYITSRSEKFEQEASGRAAELGQAQQQGIIPPTIPISGFDDLLLRDGNQEEKSVAIVSWRNGSWSGSISQSYLGEFYQNTLTLSDGTRWIVPEIELVNVRLDYTHELSDSLDLRYRIGARNIENDRAPLADRYFGFFADAHRDYGTSYYLDLMLTFN